MLLYHFDDLCKGILIFLLLIFIGSAYTYMVNLRRDGNDPKKRDYHPLAIILTPFTALLFLALGMLAILVFILRALLFAAFLITFTVMLIGLRKPFLFIWWDKFATRIGDPLLEINTRLIKMAFSLWSREPQPA